MALCILLTSMHCRLQVREHVLCAVQLLRRRQGCPQTAAPRAAAAPHPLPAALQVRTALSTVASCLRASADMVLGGQFA